MTISPDRSRRRMVTIADVAQHAGVSVPTVSKVLNGRANVSAETRQRVEAVIREHGYRRRERIGGRAPLIELIFHRLESQWALDIIRGAESLAADSGLAVVISQTPDGHSPSLGWLDAVLARRPTGIISVSAVLPASHREKLAAHSIPLVILDPAGEPVHDTPSVGATNWSGGYAAARHLVDLGHRRIGAVAGLAEVPCARARLDGCRAALDAAGAADGDLVRSGDFLVKDGYLAAAELLALPNRPTAIVAGNDLQAVGVYQAAREAGLSVPGDLSVVGFDDLDVAGWVAPRLTTIRQPLVAMAASATELVLAIARGEEPSQTRLELSTELIVRESTAPPAG